MMLRDMVRKPLEQAMVLLWLIGFSHVITRFVSQEYSIAWVISSVLAGLICVCFVVRYRLHMLIPLPVVLVLAALLVLVYLSGMSVRGLALASIMYSIGLWQLFQYLKTSPLAIRLAGILNVQELYENGEDSARRVDIFHATVLDVVLAGGFLQFAISGLLTSSGEHSLTTLITMVLVALFFLISGRFYRQAAQSYLMLLFTVFAVMEGVSLFLHSFSFQGILHDRYSGLLFVMLSFTLCATAQFLKPVAVVEAEAADPSLYRKPLMHAAILLAVTSFELQTLQVLNLDSMAIHLMPVIVLIFSSVCLLWANYQLKLPLFDVGAMLISILALMWLEFYFVHVNQSFNLWPAGGYEDQWLILGLLSLAGAFYAFYRERKKTESSGYCSSLISVSAMCYGWALLRAIMVFFEAPLSDSPFLFGMCLIFITGLFPLLYKFVYADRIRAIAIGLLLLAALINMSAVLGLAGQLRLFIAIYAFVLLMADARILPSANARWPKWAIAQDYWPWIGLILIYASLLMGGPAWPQEWPWLVGALFYQSFLRKFYLDLAAVLLLVLAALWAEADWLRPGKIFSLLPGRHNYPDLWLTLSFVALIYSVFSQWLARFPLWAARYNLLLQISAALCFAWSFLGAMVLFFAAGNGNNGLLPWIFLTLLLTLFPLSLGSKALNLTIRGVGGAILLALAVVSLLLNVKVFNLMQPGITLLAYSLWLIAGYLIPRFNRLRPDLAMSPDSWPWLGAFLVTISGAFLQSPLSTSLAAYLLVLSGYSLLLLRYSSWPGFYWIASLAFAVAGFAYSSQGILDDFQTNRISGGFPFIFAVNTLLWGNVQLLLLRLACNINSVPFERFRGQRQDLVSAFEMGALIILAGWLIAFAYFLGIISLFPVYSPGKDFGMDALRLGILLNLSFLHILSLRFSVIYLHGLILTLFLMAWSGCLAFIPAIIDFPLFLALWGFLPISAFTIGSRMRGEYQQTIALALDQWARLSLFIATIALVVQSTDELSDRLLPLAIITVLTAFWGLWTLRSAWFFLSCIEFFVFLHLWPFLWLSPHYFAVLLPWFALQASVLAWLFFEVASRFSKSDSRSSDHSKRIAVCRMALAYWPWLLCFSLAELIIHGWGVWRRLVTEHANEWLFPGFDSAAALIAGLVILGFGLRHIRKSPDSSWIYAAVMLVIAMGFYTRMITSGSASVGLVDTTLLIVFAYALFFLQRIFPSKPLLNVALSMPLLALMTVPFQLESAEASVTLMVTGVLYLMIRRYTQKQFPVYLALLAFNVGLYLWIPGIAEASRLIQVYVIPAALSLLILLQLHRNEIKPSVLMSTRLAATSTVYASAALDVFLLPDIKIFILALLLGFIGIVLGISLRIRAFLYAGVCFLLLNIIGQLMRFYPEQALGKALILMTMGAAILCSMIWFNLKKAAIMQHINLLRVELQGWE